jgi:hypothetical protein
MRTNLALLLLLLLLLTLPAGGLPPAAAQDSAPDAGRKPLLDELLKGRILRLDGNQVEIRYDFSDPAQLGDWVEYRPFRVMGEWEFKIEGDALKLKGSGALHHRATFLNEVEIEYDLVPWSDRDLGTVISEDAEGEQFVLYSVNDIYFQKFDGVRVPQHMITRFGVADSSIKADEHAFRYVARGADPKIRTHQKIHIRAGKKGLDDHFLIGEREYKGVEPGRPITQLHVGVYTVKSSALFDDVIVRGKLSPVWVEREKVELALAAPPQPEAVGPSKEDQAAQERITRFEAGTVTGEDLLPVLSDAGVSPALRQTAAASLAASGHRNVVPKAVSLLYSEDLTTRQLGDQVIRALSGKNFGYDPRSDAEKRSKAIQKLLQYIQKNPAMFGTSK